MTSEITDNNRYSNYTKQQSAVTLITLTHTKVTNRDVNEAR